MALQASEDKYLIYDSQVAPVDDEEQLALLEGNPMWFWNDRLILIWHEQEYEEKDKFWRFTAFDFITNEARPVYFSKSDSKFRQVKVITLNKDFGLIVESVGDLSSVSLVKVNWSLNEFQSLEQVNQPHQFSGVLVSNLKPTEFVLRYDTDAERSYQRCKLDSGKIEFGEIYDENAGLFEHYFNNKMFVFYGDDGDFLIDIYDWMTKETEIFSIDDLSNGEIDNWRVEWVKERVYAAAHFYDTESYGIIYMDMETKRWASLDLITDLQIKNLKYFGGNLLVYATNDIDEDESFNRSHGPDESPFHRVFKVYSIPVRYPQQLRRMAWSLVVKQFKRNEEILDPYKEATRYLPFNTDLRSKWFNDEIDLEESLGDEQSEHGSIESVGGNASESNSDEDDDVPAKRPKFN